MRPILSSIEVEWRRYKALAEGALRQVRDEELAKCASGDNSIEVIARHISGNLKSRFTDFLTSDGEKPWRDRDTEFEPRGRITREQLMEDWNAAWATMFGAIEPLTDQDLSRKVVIRGQEFFVYEALHRLVAHTSYHVGQIVFIAKSFRGSEWKSLSIPLGMSAEYNRNPTHERP